MIRDDNFYRKWALYHDGEATLKRRDAVVLVEGKTDKPFWEKVFTHAQKQVRVLASVHVADTTAATTANDNRQPGGKQACLKYLPYLGKRFFICIDSDYDYIRQAQPARNAQTFVLQTYAYAIENHYLASHHRLQGFLKKYSVIIYPAFLTHLATGSVMRDFLRDIALAGAHDKALDTLQRNLQAKYPDTRTDAPVTADLTPDNAYLFINAKMLKRTLQCGEELSFTHFPMNRIQADIDLIFNPDKITTTN
jgi:hypothetical protein